MQMQSFIETFFSKLKKSMEKTPSYFSFFTRLRDQKPILKHNIYTMVTQPLLITFEVIKRRLN